MSKDDVRTLYEKLFPVGTLLLDISSKLIKMENHPEINELRENYCDELLSFISSGFIIYDDPKYLKKNEYVIAFINNVEKLPQTKFYFWGVYSFFKGDFPACLSYIKQDLKEKEKDLLDNPLTEGDIVSWYIEPYKNAFSGFWNKLQEYLMPFTKKDGTHMLPQLMNDYYSCNTNEEAIDILTEFIRKYPDRTVPREYLGCTYYNLKRWNNAIAYLEKIEQPHIFSMNPYQIEFMLAWSYGKIRDYKSEELHYRSCLNQFKEMPNALNNLGYSLYKQKKFGEAKKIFEQCLDEHRDLPCAANNYILSLIALGQNKDAKKFVSQSKNVQYKISRQLINRVQALENSNTRLKKQEICPEENDTLFCQQEKFDIGMKKQQFLSEKLLEDELTMRIESGMPVFGLKLKVYRRHGEYGRQYIIPIGRLDLLCEDGDGNLYIIELKKDSGYDDAYLQITKYLDWFENEPKFHNQKVTGIICLNSPSDILISKVHADPRIRLFEYSISYNEI